MSGELWVVSGEKEGRKIEHRTFNPPMAETSNKKKLRNQKIRKIQKHLSAFGGKVAPSVKHATR